MALKAVLFDMDHTLLNLDVDWAKAEIRMEKICPEKLMGPRNKENIWSYFVRVNQGYKKLPAVRRRLFLRELRKMECEGAKSSAILPFTKRVVKALAKDYALGVVSSNSVYAVRLALRKFGLLKYFKVIIGKENAGMTKPAPDSILAALRKLRVKPENAVFVGDHTTDLVSGRVAKVRVIAVTTGSKSAEELAKCKPDLIIRNLGEVKAWLSKQ